MDPPAKPRLKLALAAAAHPQRLMLLAHGAPDPCPSRRRSHDHRRPRRIQRSPTGWSIPELRYLWDSLTPNERRVLTALVLSFSPFQREAQVLTGVTAPAAAPPSGPALETKAIIERTEEDNLRILDPTLLRLGNVATEARGLQN